MRLILIALLLAGCATKPIVTPPDIVRIPPPEAMVYCDAPAQAGDGSLNSVYVAAVGTAHKYYECAAIHKELVDYINGGTALK